MTTSEDLLEILRDEIDMIEHGFFVQCITDGGGSMPPESRIETLLTELLSSGQVEIGEEKQIGPGASEFVAWKGTVQDRLRRASDAVRNADGHDKQFAYWLCRRDKVDRYE